MDLCRLAVSSSLQMQEILQVGEQMYFRAIEETAEIGNWPTALESTTLGFLKQIISDVIGMGWTANEVYSECIDFSVFRVELELS
mmetsp:Transcript_19660/g.42749  ORF Transcript_19660/g.42749 Transcript_19660/m.42749 type:complete len:85 (-) Transcript_19660:84-338(-)